MTGRGGVRVEVLGPIRVLNADGCERTPSGVLQRRLLALLVLHRGRVVSVDTAIDALWPSAPPRDAVGALQNHVSRLRDVLPGGSLESVAAGYRLRPDGIEVDVDRLAALLADEAALDLAAVTEIDELLDRWHGPAFPELGDVDEGRAESTRLEELRIQAGEACAAYRLAQGDTDGLVAELRSLADADPLRERPRSLLIDALAATGRRAEALRVYDDFRRLLGDELGIDPSPALAAQHAALLGASPDEPAPVAAGRVPAPTTPMIGRDELTDEILSLVASSRLVTLVGPGGVGKTRLLVEVGNRLATDLRHARVAFCELASADTTSVANAVAASLGIDRRPDVPPAEQVATVLGTTELVLLVDNCEHVIEAIADLVERMLALCPTLRVVATSRERLRVPGEHVRRVPLLDVDGEASPAARLFVQRANAAVGTFAPGPDGMTIVQDVVRRLDGLPLAIELAAARLHTHGLADVAAGLDRRFALLSAGPRTSARHGSLGAAVSWSFDALDGRLQEVFAALSVFAAPFRATDAADVCGTDHAEMAASLDELCERSLVARAPDGRYSLLETLRAFGAEQLVMSGRADGVRARHARHLVEWVEAADRRMLAPGQPVIAEIDATIPELHAAFRWLLDRGDVEVAGRLVVAIADYALLRLRPDVLAWAEAVAASDPEDRSPVASRVWALAGYAAWMAGDVAETGVRSARALAVADGGAGHAEAATIRGNYELFEGRLDAALEWYRRADAAATTAGDVAQHLIAAATELLALGYAGDASAGARADALLAEVGDDATPHAAHAWYCAGEAELTTHPERAKARLERALELAERTGAALVTGLAGASRASVEARDGDPERAARHFRELIDHWRRAGMWSTQWTMLRSIVGLLCRLDREHDAAVVLGAIQATHAGHRVFGADEVALRDVARRLRDRLGTGAYDDAIAEGALLDGDAAVERALQAL